MANSDPTGSTENAAPAGGENVAEDKIPTEGVSVSDHQVDVSLTVDTATAQMDQSQGESACNLGAAGEHDLLAALHGLDGIGNIDHALDQLTHSTDLFDMPPLDFGDFGHH